MTVKLLVAICGIHLLNDRKLLILSQTFLQKVCFNGVACVIHVFFFKLSDVGVLYFKTWRQIRPTHVQGGSLFVIKCPCTNVRAYFCAKWRLLFIYAFVPLVFYQDISCNHWFCLQWYKTDVNCYKRLWVLLQGMVILYM